MGLNPTSGNIDLLETKECTKCTIDKAIDKFHKDRTKSDGLESACKECNEVIKVIYRRNNKEKIKLYHKDNYISVRTIPFLTEKEKKDRARIYNVGYSKTHKKRFYIYKHSATRKGIDFEISFEQFLEYWQKPCHYCGVTIETVGIDRVDNSIGYKLSNIVSCCTNCNSMKVKQIIT